MSLKSKVAEFLKACPTASQTDLNVFVLGYQACGTDIDCEYCGQKATSHFCEGCMEDIRHIEEE